ncbi:MAG TPA: ABC transporter permease [Candidatus Eisenbacteria bacterium]|nr:ABC transporter permease [Candidatus Eisenbacteria bacterium]
MTYAEIVVGQFRKHREAVWCLRAFAVIFLLATYAPFLALDVPFYTDLPGAPAVPWLSALFDPTVFPLAVDGFFNLLMGTLPLLIVLWLVARRRRLRAVLAWSVLHLILFLWIEQARDEWRTPVRDYPREVFEAKASAVFPPVRHHPGKRESQFSLTKPFSKGNLQPTAPPPPEELWPYYILGSDNLGNDVLTRLLYGARVSLTIGLLAVGLDLLLGVALGALAGYLGGWVDDLLMFLAQAFLVIPVLFLILFLMSVVEKPSIYAIVVVIALVGWPGVMRLVRGEFLRQREIDYVTAARALGLPNRRIMFRHIVPNTLAPVFVSATFGVAGTILLESTLAFLGLGDPGAPSWGQILKIGYENRDTGRHLIWAGGLAIFAVVLIVNVIGEALRDALDPKLRR